MQLFVDTCVVVVQHEDRQTLAKPLLSARYMVAAAGKMETVQVSLD